MNALAQQIQAEFSRRLHYRRDRIPGGLGDKAKVQDFDREQVAKGIRVEMEHTSDPRVALEITLDHLSESPTYYDELGKLKLSRMLSAEFARRRHVYGKFVEGDHPRDEEGKFVATSESAGSTSVAHGPEFRKWFGTSKVVDEDGDPLVVYHGTSNKFDEFKTDTRNDWSDSLGFDTYFFSEGKAVASTYASQFKDGTVIPVYVSLKRPLVIDANGGEWIDALGKAVDEVRTYRTEQERRFLDKKEQIEEDFSYELEYEPDAIPADEMAALENARKELEQHILDNRQLYKTAPRKPFKYDGIIVKNVMDMTSEPVSDDAGDYSPFTTVHIAFKPTQIKSATRNKGTYDPDDPRMTYSLRSLVK